MALVKMKELLLRAQKENKGCGAFSVGNMEMVKGVIKEKQLITGFITKEDDIGTVESPFGKVQLVQLIGVKAEEIEQMKNKTMTPAQLAEILKDGLTDYKR